MAEDLLKKLSEKLDSIDKRLTSLETPPKPKEDAVDPRIAESEVALRALLKGSFKEDTLKTMSLEKLLLAATLKEAFIAPSTFIDPPQGSKKKEDANTPTIPEIFRAHMESTDPTQRGELI